jgi:hypothetical protein
VYPVISIQGFKGSPYFCGKELPSPPAKPILREGAIYVRDVAAKTVLVAGPDHWNAILKIATGQRQTEFLEHLRSLLEQLGISLQALIPGANPSTSSTRRLVEEDILKWLEAESSSARSRLKAVSATAGLFEVKHYPVDTSATWNQAELATAAQRSVCRNTGWPIGVVDAFTNGPAVRFGGASTISAAGCTARARTRQTKIKRASS